jgi:hypothetical protein
VAAVACSVVVVLDLLLRDEGNNDVVPVTESSCDWRSAW